MLGFQAASLLERDALRLSVITLVILEIILPAMDLLEVTEDAKEWSVEQIPGPENALPLQPRLRPMQAALLTRVDASRPERDA